MVMKLKSLAAWMSGGLVLAATAAVAGNGVGGVFNLGTVNSVDARTTLRGSTTSQQLFVRNQSTSKGSTAIFGLSSGGTGVWGQSSWIGLRGAGAGAAGLNYGLFSTTASADGFAGYFMNTSKTTNAQLGRGIRSLAAGATAAFFNARDGAAGGEFAGPNGVIGVASNQAGAGVVGRSGAGKYAVFGAAVAADGFGGYFQNLTGVGVRALAEGASASLIPTPLVGGGEFVGPIGVIAIASESDGIGVYARQGQGRYALYALGPTQIVGSLNVAGKLTKTSGTFKIDHPQDPANKYLSHSFVESPDMMNIYNGNIVTDASGEAVVELPSYFEALNRDPRYQLTVIGSFAAAQVAEEVKNNTFLIRTSEPGIKVSWQVTGIRQDAFAKAHPIVVEEEKKLAERGHYLHPEEHGQPADLAIGPAQGHKTAQSNDLAAAR